MKTIIYTIFTGVMIMTFGFSKSDATGPMEGQKAIDFELNDQGGNFVKLSEFKGQMIVLYFFPKAHTPG